MVKAKYKDKGTVVRILSEAFKNNQSVNYIVKSDSKRFSRLMYLMEYSFELCFRYGEVYLSEDRNACALISYPNRKKGFSLTPYLLDAKLLFKTIGLSNLKKAATREEKIKRQYPESQFLYLWFIGVSPASQGQGLGSKLLEEVLTYANEQDLPVYVETSTVKNLPWYKNYNFSVYHKLELSYSLYMLRTSTNNDGI